MRAVLGAISRWFQAWNDVTEHPLYRAVGVAIGLVVGAVVFFAPLPAGWGLPLRAQTTAAVAAVMALWWVGRVLPMAVTSLVPLIAFPILGVAPIAETAAPYAHPLIFLMLGGFLIGHAMERVGLHNRLVSGLLAPRFIRRSPALAIGALMVAAALLSGLVSNTATTLMLLPLAVALAGLYVGDERGRTAFVLALAYAASIGGVATLVGTPPNAVLAKESGNLGFATWMLVGLPFVALALPAAWFVVTRIALPVPWRSEVEPERPRQGRPTVSELAVLLVVALAMLLWLTRQDIHLFTAGQGADALWIGLPGWSNAALPGHVDDAWVAMLAAVTLTLLPTRRQGRWRFLIGWRKAEKAIPWSVLLLLGGGFSLANGIKDSGLTEWLGGGTAALAWLTGPDAPLGATVGSVVAIGLICLVMTFLTELTSNTATTQIMLPILASGAALGGVDPMLWMVPATISASCAFMMPVATAPNAIAAEAGGVAPGDMAFAGLLLNFVCVVIATGIAATLVPLVF